MTTPGALGREPTLMQCTTAHRPVVRILARRRSLSTIVAVIDRGKLQFMIYLGSLSLEHLIAFT